MDKKNSKRKTLWMTYDPSGTVRTYETSRDKTGKLVKGKHINTETEKHRNTIAFKKKYKVSPNFATFSLLIGGTVLFIPYSLYIVDKFLIVGKMGTVVYHAGKIVYPGQEIWPLELWIMLFLPLIILGIILRVMNNKYGTSIEEFSKKINKLKFLKMFR